MLSTSGGTVRSPQVGRCCDIVRAQAQVHALEAWFCCFTFSEEPGFEPDLNEARAALRDAEANLEAVEARVTRAAARLAKFERRLQSLTSGHPEV